jgi:MFS superfamily sulfate permease-like transporter
MVCFAGVAVFGAIAGIALAVVMAVIEFLWDGWRPQFNDRHASGIEPCFAEMKDPVKDKLKRFGLFTRLGEHTFFATLGEVVAAYRAAIPSSGSTGRSARRRGSGEASPLTRPSDRATARRRRAAPRCTA